MSRRILCAAQAGGGSRARSALRWRPDLLGRRCGLFGRKFSLEAAAALLLVMETMHVIPRAEDAISGMPKAADVSAEEAQTASGRVKP